MNDQELALSNVNAALAVLKDINDLYLSANAINQQHMAKLAERRSKKGRDGKLQYRVGLGVVGLFMWILLRSLYKALKDAPEALGVFVMIVYLIFCIVVIVPVRRKLKKKVDERYAAPPDEEENYQKQLDAISKEIYNTTISNQEIINKLPRDYRYYDAAVYFEKALANGQAESMKEAINLYEEHMHRMALEEDSKIALEQSRRQSAMLADIQDSSRQTAKNSAIAATFSVLNFMDSLSR